MLIAFNGVFLGGPKKQTFRAPAASARVPAVDTYPPTRGLHGRKPARVANPSRVEAVPPRHGGIP